VNFVTENNNEPKEKFMTYDEMKLAAGHVADDPGAHSSYRAMAMAFGRLVEKIEQLERRLPVVVAAGFSEGGKVPRSQDTVAAARQQDGAESQDWRDMAREALRERDGLRQRVTELVSECNKSHEDAVAARHQVADARAALEAAARQWKEAAATSRVIQDRLDDEGGAGSMDRTHGLTAAVLASCAGDLGDAAKALGINPADLTF
jgi:hypothetical protein